jgi:hypothetical protein
MELNRLLAEKLDERGHYLEYITESKIIYDYLNSHETMVYDLRAPFNKYIKHYEPLSLEKKKRVFDEKYEDISLKDLTKADMVLGSEAPDVQYTIALSYLDSWNDYFNNCKCDLAISTDGTEIPNISFGIMGRYKKIPVLFTNGTSIFNNKMVWDKSILLNSWVDPMLMKERLHSSQLRHSKNYIDSLTTKKPVIGFITIKPLSRTALVRTKNFIENCILNEEQKSRNFNPINMLGLGIMPYIRRPVSTGYYKEPDLNEPFIFFPMHHPIDAQITFRANEYVRQDRTVSLISDAIPQGITLYVKPHPHCTGMYPLNWLKSISRIKNVKIIQPNVNSHTLIENCKFVITINSEVGWEALLHGKHVITLAKPFYSRLGYTHEVEDISELPGVIDDVINKPTIPKSKIIKLVHAAYSSTYDGGFYTKSGGFNTNHENLNNIVDGILKSYERYYN